LIDAAGWRASIASIDAHSAVVRYPWQSIASRPRPEKEKLRLIGAAHTVEMVVEPVPLELAEPVAL